MTWASGREQNIPDMHVSNLPYTAPMSGSGPTAGTGRGSTTTGSIPEPGQAIPPTPSIAALLRRNRDDPAIAGAPALLFGDQMWTHAQFVAESCRWANYFRAVLPADKPPHVAVLLDNTPDYLFAFGGAALAGAAIVGLNHTRQGEHLRRDAVHTDTALLITEPAHLDALAPIAGELPFDEDRILVSRRFGTADRQGASIGRDLEPELDGVSSADPELDPDPSTTWALIFTSGTTSAPKAVICSQRRILTTGTRLGMILGVDGNDVGYVCMPLFHSNAIMVGWAPSLVYGCAVGLGRKFSASGWLPDVRRYGATYFNYTGKPLSYIVATPERPDDADNPLRIAFGNEGSPEVVETFSRRFGVEVIDAFGATEGGISLDRGDEVKPGAMGIAGPNIKIVAEDGTELPVAELDENGRLVNAEQCVGEIVNVSGAGPFEGYYNNPDATSVTTRNGWYWSGDLGYLDAERNLFFAGRNADWIRVDGENFPAGPIEDALTRHPDVVLGVVYGVPDEQAGDQVMAALVLRPGATFDSEGFASWVDELTDVGPKWRPRYLRLAAELPTTGTNKVVKRTLVHQKFRRDRVGDDPLLVRGRGDDRYHEFRDADEKALRTRFIQAGRERFWDL
jgi:fatty-acyl-CoA synthase